jgi:hypothetical protein
MSFLANAAAARPSCMFGLLDSSFGIAAFSAPYFLRAFWHIGR